MRSDIFFVVSWLFPELWSALLQASGDLISFPLSGFRENFAILAEKYIPYRFQGLYEEKFKQAAVQFLNGLRLEFTGRNYVITSF